jgi:2-polyprenyl-3-methyl-5-hydroxy-6-metoxy-1,4-benzoquinol methylase
MSTHQSREAVGLWDVNAEFWNQMVGLEGNKYWKRLQEPSLQRLLGPHLEAADAPRRALDLACGNGLCTRWLASHGEAVGEIWATDGSQPMVDQAKSYGSANGRISFQKLDVTVAEDFIRLQETAAGVRLCAVASRRGTRLTWHGSSRASTLCS